MPACGDHASLSELRMRIESRIHSRTLPRAGEQKIFAGFGGNETCDICGRPIGKAEVLYEVELSHGLTDPVVLAMHLSCFKVWIEQSQRTHTDASELVS